jgi:3-dehydroquinate synthase
MVEPVAPDGITRIEVSPTGETPYTVQIGTGLLGELAEAVAGTTRVAVLHPRALRTTADAIRDDLMSISGGPEVHLIEVPDGEEAKDLKVAAYAWSVLGQVGFTRDDLVIGLGGGAVTDIAGFIAATWLRGVPWWMPRSAGRPPSTLKPERTWSARSISRPRCCATSPPSRRCPRTSSSRALPKW